MTPVLITVQVTCSGRFCHIGGGQVLVLSLQIVSLSNTFQHPFEGPHFFGVSGASTSIVVMNPAERSNECATARARHMPFSGSGTTGAVAKRLGRIFIGIERDETYAAAAERRIAGIAPAEDSTIATTTSKRHAPRIPFGMVIERGLLRPGAMLYGPKKRHSAKVRADGSIITQDRAGSIHQIGAHVQGLGACNGWTFWHYNEGKSLTPIDALREQIRAEIGAVS